MIPIFKDIFVQKNYLGKALISSVPEQREGTEVVEIAVQDVCLLDFKLRRLMMTSHSKSPLSFPLKHLVVIQEYTTNIGRHKMKYVRPSFLVPGQRQVAPQFMIFLCTRVE